MLRRKVVTATAIGAIMFAAFLGCANEKSSSETNGNNAAGNGNKAAANGEKEKGKQKPAGKEKPAGKSTTKGEPIALKDFPTPKEAKVFMTAFDTRTIMMRGPNKMDETIKYYETNLGEKGWTIDKKESITEADMGFRKFEKGGLKIEITLNPGRDGKDMTIIAQGSGVSVPKDDNGDDTE